MSHVLAIYTVLYVAILFTTVGIWASDIAAATGDFRILLFTLGAFGLKIAIDDYVHFSKKRTDLQPSLFLSLVIYLLLAGSIANAALARPRVASGLFALVFLVGTVWILIGDRETGPLAPLDKQRRTGWAIINIVSIGLLVWASVLGVQQTYSAAKTPLSLMFAVVIVDFFVFGTLRRLADEAARAENEVARLTCKAQSTVQTQADEHGRPKPPPEPKRADAPPQDKPSSGAQQGSLAAPHAETEDPHVVALAPKAPGAS